MVIYNHCILYNHPKNNVQLATEPSQTGTYEMPPCILLSFSLAG